MKLELAAVSLMFLFLVCIFLYTLLNHTIKNLFSKSWTHLLKFIKIQQDLCPKKKKILGINRLLAGVSASEKSSGAGTSLSPWQHIGFICSAQSCVITQQWNCNWKFVHCSFPPVHTGQIYWAGSTQDKALLEFQQPQNPDVQWFPGAVFFGIGALPSVCQVCAFVGSWAHTGCSSGTIYPINQLLWINTALSPKMSGSCKGFIIATLKSKRVVLVRWLMFQKGKSEFLIFFHCPPNVPLPLPQKVMHVGLFPWILQRWMAEIWAPCAQRNRPRSTNFYESAWPWLCPQTCLLLSPELLVQGRHQARHRSSSWSDKRHNSDILSPSCWWMQRLCPGSSFCCSTVDISNSKNWAGIRGEVSYILCVSRDHK